jgi:hypothetical protein
MKVTQKKQEAQPVERILSRVCRFGVYGALQDEERADAGQRLQELQAVVIDAVSTCTLFGRRRDHAKTHSACVLHWQIPVRRFH